MRIARDRAWSVSRCCTQSRTTVTVQRVTLGRLIPEINRKQVQNTNQGAAVSDRKAIFVESQDFSLPHLHSRPPLGGSRRNIAMPFGMEKLEWYPMVDKC